MSATRSFPTHTHASHAGSSLGAGRIRRQWGSTTTLFRVPACQPPEVLTPATFSPKPQSPFYARTHRPFPHPRRKRQPASKPPRAASRTHTHTHTHTHTGHTAEQQQQKKKRHGGEQQHHGVRDADGADLRAAGDRLGRLVRVGAGGGVRAAGAVARGHPGRAHPPHRPRGLRGRLLEPEAPPGLLPLRHGGAHRAPHRAARLRLRRHQGIRGLPRARPRLRRVPPRRVLHVAPRVRLRRPWPVGGDPVLPCRLRHLQEARTPGQLRHRRPVLPVQPHASPVGVLQAAVGVRVRVREPDGVDEPSAAGGGPGLRGVEQRPGAAVLRVRVVPRGAAGGAAGPVAQGQHRARRRHRRPRLPLPRRMQRLQERPGRGHLPALQVVRRSRSGIVCCQFASVICMFVLDFY